MVEDAKQHADADKQFQALAEAKNQGNSLIHASEKSLNDQVTKLKPMKKLQLKPRLKT